MTENDLYRFDGISKGVGESFLNFYLKERDLYLKCRCQYGPSVDRVPNDICNFISSSDGMEISMHLEQVTSTPGIRTYNNRINKQNRFLG